jgi:hypothetical protein
MRVQGIGLEDHGHAPILGRDIRHVPAADPEGAAGLGFQPGNDTQQGGFAAPGRAEKRNEFTVPDVEVDALQDINRPKRFANVVHGNGSHAFLLFADFGKKLSQADRIRVTGCVQFGHDHPAQAFRGGETV